MQKFLRWSWYALLTTLAAVGIAACGGNNSLPPKANISKVYVMGDSLADVGTFGFKYTTQDASNNKGFPIWTQLVTGNFGLNGSAQCNAYTGTATFNASGDWTSENYADNTVGCTNYAIGGSRIVLPASAINPNANATNPRNIVKQF